MFAVIRINNFSLTIILLGIFSVLSSCSPDNKSDKRTSWIVRWNEIAITASGRDHTPPKANDNWKLGQQMGPTRSSRALAIVHIAMYDAIMSINPRYTNYLDTPRSPSNASMKAAIAQAAHDTLVEFYPSQKEIFQEALKEDLSHIPDGESKEDGITLGKLTALQILNERHNDGSEWSTPGLEVRYDVIMGVGTWHPDPIHTDQKALTPEWGKVKPFAMRGSSQFRVPPPPRLNSPEYAKAFNEVKRLGGDGVITPTERTEEQTNIGFFWGYDGTPSLCAPVKLYNQIASQIGQEQKLDVVDMARLLTLVNIALADAGIAAWESKYYWNFWRPVSAIREADPGTGPTGNGDGNPLTEGDLTFTSLGAPAVNGAGRNFTPPFPTYPSGHAVFGGALFEVLRNFFGTDKYSFSFVSEEFNGVTTDQYGELRPLLPRSFNSFSEAEDENGQSRIYLGIHFSFDKTEGIIQGRKIGELVSESLLKPIYRNDS